MQAATSSHWISPNIERCGPRLRSETSVAVAIAHLQSQSSSCLWVSQSAAPTDQNNLLPPASEVEGYVTANDLLHLIATPDPAGRNPLEQSLGAIAHPPSIITVDSAPLATDVEATTIRLRQDNAPFFLVVDQHQRVQGQISREALQQAVIERLLHRQKEASSSVLATASAAPPPYSQPAPSNAVHPELQAALAQLSQALLDLETHGQAEAKLQHRIDFEALLTQISTEFLNLQDGEIDQALHSALARTASFTDCDRACIFQYSYDGHEAHCRHEWNRDNLIPFTKPLCSILRRTFPWSLEQMQQQQAIHVPDVEALPPEASPEQDAARQLQAKSYVVLPLRFQGEPLGWLAFYAVHQAKTWAAADLQQLETLGSIIAGVIARQQAAAALEELETKFEQLVANLHQVFFIYQTDPHQLLYISPAYEEIWGLSSATLYEQPDHWASTIHPEDYDRVMAEMNRRRTEGISVDLEYRIICPNGEERWIHSRSFPLRNRQGHINRLAGIAEDVSDRHRYEVALARSEEKFSKAFRFNPIPMAITVMGEGRYLEVNDAFCEHSGFSREAVVGKTIADLNRIVEPAQWKLINQTLLDQGSFQNLELHTRTRQGQIRITQSSGILLDVDGERRVLIISHDITEQRQQETQRQQMEQALRQATRAAQAANRAKGECLAMVSHEIRTPLNAILSMSDLLLKEGLSANQQETLEILQNGGEELLEILDEVLDFSRLDASQFAIEVAPFDLKLCLEEVRDLFLPQAQAKGLELQAELSPQLPTTLVGDSKRLKQILNNLLGNAIKFSAAGEILITVHPNEANPEELLFSVRDQGIGINQAGLDRLFEPYSQADASIAQRYGGTGLGLNICDRLVHRLGGTIWVESGGKIGGTPPKGWALRQGKPNPEQGLEPTSDAQTASTGPNSVNQHPEIANLGSHFYFTLPRVFSPQPEPLQTDSSTSNDPTEASQPPASETPIPAPIDPKLPPTITRMLIVEDIQLNQRVAQLLLQRMGYDAELVSSGEAAIAILDRKSYDVIFLDLNLPEINGYQIYQHIQSLPQQPWVIAMSASVDGSSRDRCYSLGMNDFVPKPVSQEDLTQALTYFWQYSQQQVVPAKTGSMPSAPPAKPSSNPETGRASAGETVPADDKTDFPPCSSNAPSLRLDIFNEVRQMCSDTRNFDGLLSAYRADAQRQLQAMVQALENQNGLALFEVLHSLGPAASSLGGQRLADLCLHLENQLRDHGCYPYEAQPTKAIESRHWGTIGPQIQEIQAEYQRLTAAIEFQTWEIQ